MTGWYFGNTRDADLEELRKDATTSRDPKARRLAEEAGRRISNESGRVRSMREALAKAHARGDVNEIKNIHEDIRRDPSYQNR